MSYVGYTGVANQAQTTPGCALGVVADANNSYGDDDGGSRHMPPHGEVADQCLYLAAQAVDHRDNGHDGNEPEELLPYRHTTEETGPVVLGKSAEDDVEECR